jgi:hypothetical protein
MNHAAAHYVILFVSLQEGTMVYDDILGLVLEGTHPDISVSIYYTEHFFVYKLGRVAL